MNRKMLFLLLSLLFLTPLTRKLNAQTADASVILREETTDALVLIRWKGPQLTDETRFAVAASGLSWRPEIAGHQLISAVEKSVVYAPAANRVLMWQKSQRLPPDKLSIPVALSLALDPSTANGVEWREAKEHLALFGNDFDRMLIGILQAPDKMPLLHSYQYAALNILVERANPRILPLFLTLAESKDPYYRARAAIGLGIIGYRKVDNGMSIKLQIPLRIYGISTVVQRIIAADLHRLATDGNWRVREAAATGMSMIADKMDIDLLRRMARDSAMLVQKEPGGKKIVNFPVREAAVKALERLNEKADSESGVYDLRQFKKVSKSANDVTRQHMEIKKEQLGTGSRFELPF